jgi:hypothetical protein
MILFSLYSNTLSTHVVNKKIFLNTLYNIIKAFRVSVSIKEIHIGLPNPFEVRFFVTISLSSKQLNN